MLGPGYLPFLHNEDSTDSFCDIFEVLAEMLILAALACEREIQAAKLAAMGLGASKRRQETGLSAGNTLLLMTLIAALVFTLASTSLTHLHLSQKRSHSQVAVDKSHSMVAKILARILEDPSYGTHDETVEIEELEGTRLSFSTAEAPYSFNNLEGEGSTLAWGGRVVPPQSIHLVARSRQNSSEKIVEALYTIPAFPYAVASSVPIKTEGSLVVGRVESAEVAQRSLATEELLPADLSSNAGEAGAIFLGEGAYVSGDVTAVGQVSLGSSVQVRGSVKNDSEEVALPRIDFSRYDPADDAATLHLGAGSASNPGLPPSIEGLVRYQGSLVHTGPLEMDNGILFVDGDLSLNLDSSLRGGIQGFGAIIITGRTTIRGASNFSHVNSVALLSQGDIEILGDDQENSFFQGLLYGEGSIKAEKITVLGALISNSRETSDQVFLKEVRAIHTDQSLQIDVGHAPSWTFHIFQAPTPQEGETPPGSIHQQAGLESLEADYSVYYSRERKSVRLVANGKATVKVRSVISVTDDGAEGNAAQLEVLEQQRARAGGLSANEFHSEALSGNGDNVGVFGQVPELSGIQSLDSQKGGLFEFEISLDDLRDNPDALLGLTLEAPEVREVANSTLGSLTKSYEIVTIQRALDQDNARSLRAKLLENLTPGGPTTRYNFDPNEFLALADKIRLKFLKVH